MSETPAPVVPDPRPGLVPRRTTPDDWAVVRGLLTEAGLPLGGAHELLASAKGGLWAIDGDSGGSIDAIAGLEVHGPYGLLRSVAVVSDLRARGLGRSVVGAALDAAWAEGLCAVYLLTTSAADYFPRLGFGRIERGEVPEAIRASGEFSSLCPDSATVMALRGPTP